ncbi:photosystem I assembly factor PSA3, chloroplastic [Silene latifolia]|uniref:photosystem I assembly factor PSA3, chloroplastic n=1 Tax=Silene latifolia TaxID=37657 RepID=UPI003D7710A0
MANTISPPQISARHSYTPSIPTHHFHTFHQLINPNSTFNSNHKSTQKSKIGRRNCMVVRAYIENTNPFANFASKVIGSLPVIGLIARIANDEGGLAGDIIDFAEFRRRVGNKCTINDSRAFYEFQVRRGKAGDPLNVLLCCWLAALGAGLLKSEEILEGVARLSISDDIEFEEQTFIAKMTEARERRAKSGTEAPRIPMEVRAEKAVDAIYVCCFDNNPIEEDDVRLLTTMLTAVFPTVQQPEIERIIKQKAQNVAESSENEEYPVKPKPLTKEAIQLQMKDLQFLKQNNTE